MDKSKKIYFNGYMSFEELLEAVSYSDIPLTYKNRRYNITYDDGKPCIAVIKEGCDVWCATVKYYDTYEDLLLNHVFDDGVRLIDALVKDIKP